MSASMRTGCRQSGRRAHARARAWAAGAAPDHDGWLHLDVDATITVDHSDNKEHAAATWKHTFGFHSLLVFLDRVDIAAGEALAGLLRPGNAGSNTTADHITVLDQALHSAAHGLPARPRQRRRKDRHLPRRTLSTHRPTPRQQEGHRRSRTLHPRHRVAPASDPDTCFHDLGADFYDRHIHPDRKNRNHIRQLETPTLLVTNAHTRESISD